MSILDQIGGVLNQFASGTTSPEQARSTFSKSQSRFPIDAQRHAQQYIPVPGDGTFGQNMGQMYAQSNPQQQAGILNKLIHAAGPSLLSRLGINIRECQSDARSDHAEQAQQISPAHVEEIANQAQQQNPGIVEQAENSTPSTAVSSGFGRRRGDLGIAAFPEIVKPVAAAAAKMWATMKTTFFCLLALSSLAAASRGQPSPSHLWTTTTPLKRSPSGSRRVRRPSDHFYKRPIQRSRMAGLSKDRNRVGSR